MTTLEALTAHTRGDNEAFVKDLKRFADKYGPLENDDFDAQVSHWWVAIVEFQKALAAWSHAQKTGDFEKLIRALERRDKWAVKRTGLGIEANVLLRNDEANGSARLCIKPRDLISAMYTQLALAVDGGVNLRSCVECRRWFALDAGRGRSDKEYCSDACRMRAYRKRKGRAARKPTRSKKR